MFPSALNPPAPSGTFQSFSEWSFFNPAPAPAPFGTMGPNLSRRHTPLQFNAENLSKETGANDNRGEYLEFLSRNLINLDRNQTILNAFIEQISSEANFSPSVEEGFRYMKEKDFKRALNLFKGQLDRFSCEGGEFFKINISICIAVCFSQLGEIMAAEDIVSELYKEKSKDVRFFFYIGIIYLLQATSPLIKPSERVISYRGVKSIFEEMKEFTTKDMIGQCEKTQIVVAPMIKSEFEFPYHGDETGLFSFTEENNVSPEHLQFAEGCIC